MGEVNPRKLMMIAAAVVVVILIFVGIAFFASPSAETKKKKSVGAELTVWTVGLDTQAVDALVAGFKAATPSAAATAVTVKKFASYAEYERMLPRAIADGNSPDIITVTNDGGWNTLGGYVERLPSFVVDPVAFRKDYPQFLVDDLLMEDATDVAVDAAGAPVKKSKAPAETRTEVASFLKGVPLGYETLAVFYNSRKMRGVPDAWSGFPEMVQGGSAPSAGDFGSGSGPQFSPLGLGLGTSVPGSADAFALLLAQQGIRGPKSLSTGVRVMDSYQAFANSPENNFAQFAPMMRSEGLTALDLFVRGKVGAVVGFPSMAREIEYAAKRAATGESKIILRSVRAGPVPQSFVAPAQAPDSASGSAAEKGRGLLSVNLVRYRYLAISKFSTHADAAAAFLTYLASKPGQELAAKAFPWLIPAHREVAQAQLRTPIALDWKVTKEPFMVDGADLVSFDKANAVAWDSRLPYYLDANEADARKTLSAFSAYLSCVADQDAGKGFETSCLPAGQ